MSGATTWAQAACVSKRTTWPKYDEARQNEPMRSGSVSLSACGLPRDHASLLDIRYGSWAETAYEKAWRYCGGIATSLPAPDTQEVTQHPLNTFRLGLPHVLPCNEKRHGGGAVAFKCGAPGGQRRVSRTISRST